MKKSKKTTFPYTKQNNADRLISLITESDHELFHDQLGQACIVNPKEPLIARRLRSSDTTSLIAKLYWDTYKKTMRPDILKSVILALEGIALYDNEQRETYTRVAKIGNTIYYDLGDNIHVVKITPEGWNVNTDAPVYFRRYAHQLPQVMPERGGDIKHLIKYIHIDGKTNEILLTTYLPICLIADIDRPLILMHGPQGAGKSTALEFIRSLIDPSRLPLLQPPKEVYEMIQQANKHYAYFLDNVSFIKHDVSDALCRFVTGSAFSKRMLYTDDDDVLYEFKRVTGFTSIAQVASNADLLDRSLIIPLEMISEMTRKPDEQLNSEFQMEKPLLLGNLFDVVSSTMKNLSSISLQKLPRMADYYRYAASASECLGYGKDKYVEAFAINAKHQNQETIESSPIIQSILIFMKGKYRFTDTSTGLYWRLKMIAERFEMMSGFPKGATWLWRKIQESRATLVAIGIKPENSHGTESRYITIEKTEKYNPALDESIPEWDEMEKKEAFSDNPDKLSEFQAKIDDSNQISVTEITKDEV